MNFGLKGVFSLTLKKDGVVKQQTTFENLILDSGLDMLGKTTIYYAASYLHIGAGNSQPVATQVNLDSWLEYARRERRYLKAVLDGDEKYHQITNIYRIPTGKEYNISEIGVSDSSSQNATLFCRTLVKNERGEPVVITKLADEILEISYTLKIIIPTQDFTGTINISGEPYHYIARSSQVNSVIDNGSNSFALYTGTLSAITSEPTGRLGSYSFNSSAYKAGSHRIERNVFLSIDQGNHQNGIRSIKVHALTHSMQVEFRKVSDGSAIPKDNTKTLTLKFAYSWGRA